jgi:hypothetical protein
MKQVIGELESKAKGKSSALEVLHTAEGDVCSSQWPE